MFERETPRNRRAAAAGLVLAALLLTCPPALAEPRGTGETLADLVDRKDYEALRQLGPEIMPELAALYSARAPADRRRVAWAFYQLGWKSEEAVAALLPDVEGDKVPLKLRISAQYALGRVGGDELVIETLLTNMRHGRVPFLRDKAACALAYDQIHLDERQKLRLFRELVVSLDDPKPDVRRISLQALKIHTGQTRGFKPKAPRPKRLEAIESWYRWLAAYEEQL